MQQHSVTTRSASALAAASWRAPRVRDVRPARSPLRGLRRLPGGRTEAPPAPVRPVGPPRVGLVSAHLGEDGAARLEASAAASLAAGAGRLIVAIAPGGSLDDEGAAALLRVHRTAAAHGATVTLATSDPHLRLALSGLPVPGGAHVAASAPVAMRDAAGELAPEGRRAL